jgi:hypothetical protein
MMKQSEIERERRNNRKRPWIEYRTNACPDQPRHSGGPVGVVVIVALLWAAAGILLWIASR